MYTLFNLFTSQNTPQAAAHCDIPCKIYDPFPAQIAAHSVVRFIDILNELKGDSLEAQNAIARNIARKEEEAEHVKHNIRVIWGDYIKAPQLEKFPQIHEITHNIMLTASACKQNVSRQQGEKLVQLVNEFASIFFATKNIDVVTKKAHFLPNLPLVLPVLEDA